MLERRPRRGRSGHNHSAAAILEGALSDLLSPTLEKLERMLLGDTVGLFLDQESFPKPTLTPLKVTAPFDKKIFVCLAWQDR